MVQAILLACAQPSRAGRYRPRRHRLPRQMCTACPGWDYVARAAVPGRAARAATVVDSLGSSSRAGRPGRCRRPPPGRPVRRVPRPGSAHAARSSRHERHGVRRGDPRQSRFRLRRPVPAGRRRRAKPVCERQIWASRGHAHLPLAGRDTRRHPGRVGGLTTPGVMVWDGDSWPERSRAWPVGRRRPRCSTELGRCRTSRSCSCTAASGESTYDTTGVGPENEAARLAGPEAEARPRRLRPLPREMRDTVIGGVHFVQPKHWAQAVSVTHVDLERSGKAGGRPAR